MKKYPELKEQLFAFSGEDETFEVKFKENFFSFRITIAGPDIYENTITYVNQKTPQTLRQTWNETYDQFKHWATGIAEDIKFRPDVFKVITVKFPAEIVNYSASFPVIYNQALTAEQNGLTEICGLGFRKAFEFLIREYLLQKHPETEHEKIKSVPASQCISQYISSDEIKLIAHRVLWLGNDHAHYLKKWEDKSVDDLKRLIDFTIRWILIKDELEKVEAEMPSGK